MRMNLTRLDFCRRGPKVATAKPPSNASSPPAGCPGSRRIIKEIVALIGAIALLGAGHSIHATSDDGLSCTAWCFLAAIPGWVWLIPPWIATRCMLGLTSLQRIWDGIGDGGTWTDSGLDFSDGDGGGD